MTNICAILSTRKNTQNYSNSQSYLRRTQKINLIPDIKFGLRLKQSLSAGKLGSREKASKTIFVFSLF